MKRRTRVVVAVIGMLGWGFGGGWRAEAQMVTGREMKDFARALEVLPLERVMPCRVSFVSSDVPANIFWPEDKEGEFRFRLEELKGGKVPESARAEVVEWETQGIPKDIWTPQVVRKKVVARVPVKVMEGRGDEVELSVQAEIPAKLGGYAVVLDLGPELGRHFGCSLVRTFKPDPRPVQYPKLSLDYINGQVLGRLGVQAVRHGISFHRPDSPEYGKQMEELRREMAEMKRENITALLMVGEGDNAEPLGRPRPHLSEDGVMLSGKQDHVWLPEEDPAFEAFIRQVCEEFGWPKGPVTAMSLWNEPWEGLSISGWQADMPRYRELYKRMASGVHAAMKSAGVQVLVAGADSSSNTLDKFFADGSDEFLPLLDAVTIHYQGMASPRAIRSWAQRKPDRVKVWDTESWVANVDDRVAAVMATNRACGYDRSMGIFGGNIWSGGHAWPPAAAVGAAQQFIGQRDFNRLLFGKGLPWVMVFDGAEGNADDGTLVVVGDIGEAFGEMNVLLRSVRSLAEVEEKRGLVRRLEALAPESPERDQIEQKLSQSRPLTKATMTIEASGHDYGLYDFYGNPVEPTDGKIVVPLDHRGFFLRASGAKGSFAKLVEAVERARIEGLAPVEIVAHDMTAGLEAKPALRLTLTNVLNRPVAGKIRLALQGLELSGPAEVSLRPHESRTVPFTVTGGQARATNLYPLSVEFDAGADGMAVHREQMRVNVIARRTIEVDGKLDDWAGVTPQVVTGGDGSPTVAQAAWWPMAQFEQSATKGAATGYVAADERYFYFAARVTDSTPEPGTLRFETRDDDRFFYPEVSYEYDQEQTLLKKDSVDKDVGPDDVHYPQSPSGGRHARYWENTNRNSSMGVDFRLPADRTTRVSVHVGHGYLHPNGQSARLEEADTGRVLSEIEWKQLWDGAWLRFDAKGPVRLVLKTHGDWYTVRAGAILLDPAPAEVSTPGFVGIDHEIKGDWIGKWGRSGYVLPAGPAQLSDGVEVVPVERVVRTERRWPSGVRRFSYRQWPVLPAPYDGARYDSVQLAFNVLAPDRKFAGDSAPGTPPGFIDYPTTDYEYSLHHVAPEYGGGTEVYRLLVPGMPRKHFYPRQNRSPLDGAVKNAKLVVSYVPEQRLRIVEAAIPWEELPEVRNAMTGGRPIKFSFRVNDGGSGGIPELASERSVAKKSSLAFHVDWSGGWTNEVEFGWER